MIKKFKQKYSKKMEAFLSVMLAAAILVTGTLAWQSISQEVTNEKVLDTYTGGRLHDDFDGKNKDIYAENYSSEEENGEPLYVRVRLLEYMETGEDAGINIEEDDRKVDVLVTGADIKDKDTWQVHIPTEDDLTECESEPSFHEYWEWQLGGDTIYLPTFQKNNESLAVDVNGTWESVEGRKHYTDYETYTEGQTVEADAYYSVDSLVTGGEVKEDPEGNQAKVVKETHTAKKTQSAEVVTMKKWTEDGSKRGNYWVWDSDGWAYWAEPLNPGEATGCLLTGITMKKYLSENVHYEIHVEGEFVTAEDLGTKGAETNGAGGTGFYEKGMTEAAEALLGKITKSRLADVTVGSDETVTIDDVEFYVLAYDVVQDQYLIWAKNSIGKSKFSSSSNVWSTDSNCIAYQTLVSWLNGKEDLRTHAQTTRLTTRTTYNGNEYKITQCDVFLLSEADVYGTANGVSTSSAKEYTYGASTLVMNKTVIKGDGSEVWLRSPAGYRSSTGSLMDVALINEQGECGCYHYEAEVFGIRPALWVKGL